MKNAVVMRRIIAILLLLFLCVGFCACGKSAESELVEKKINAIGTVTLASKEAIVEAETTYIALSNENKEEIWESAQILAHARVEYDNLVNLATKQQVEEDSQHRIDNVITGIDSIGEVKLESKSAIQDAQFSYNALPEEEQEKVTNYQILVDAKEQLNELKQQANNITIEEFKDNFNVRQDVVEGITWYTPKKFPKYINDRNYVSAYMGMRNNQAWICVVCNYTGNEWVFWNEIIFVVDGVKYNWTSIKPNRSVGYGDVCENYHKVFNEWQSINSEDIQLLYAIANSTETIVRFKGSKQQDFTLPQDDKDAIKDILDFYDSLEY